MSDQPASSWGPSRGGSTSRSGMSNSGRGGRGRTTSNMGGSTSRSGMSNSGRGGRGGTTSNKGGSTSTFVRTRGRLRVAFWRSPSSAVDCCFAFLEEFLL
ncbi:hypothetical protein Cni_G07653 [Canna indica]|uniref:Uncharacterized protein n=1 Tax=Canna indica TaxID=4628 RepID=A0AAQ3JZ21_9LILI|nr:hypothetical protein Cni_G07653 [Canna indica]